MIRILTGLALVASVALLGLPLRAADEKAVFNGTSLDGWKFKDKAKSKWVVGRCSMDEKENGKLKVTVIPPQADGGPAAREMINSEGGGSDIYTEEKFGDCTIDLEFMVPKGSNSGVYVMGEYEVQILDSFGKDKIGPGDVGGLYGAAAPKVNAAKKPGEWQRLVIEFRAPTFDGDKKTANAKFVSVKLNDQVIHEGVEMKGPTPSGLTGKEAPTGPLMFQGDHGPVAFRNVKVTPRGGK